MDVLKIFKVVKSGDMNQLRWRLVIMTVNLEIRQWRKGLARYQKATVFQYLKGFHEFAALHCTLSPYIKPT
jgi:hypothetical protein